MLEMNGFVSIILFSLQIHIIALLMRKTAQKHFVSKHYAISEMLHLQNIMERIEADGVQIEFTNVMTGDKNKSRFLYY